jgi:hypothetical protein
MLLHRVTVLPMRRPSRQQRLPNRRALRANVSHFPPTRRLSRLTATIACRFAIHETREQHGIVRRQRAGPIAALGRARRLPKRIAPADFGRGAHTSPRFAVDSPVEERRFEPSVPRVGNYAHETALFDRHGIFRPFSTAAAPDLE